MKRFIGILLIWMTLISSVYAELVVLRSGKTVKGEILLHNEEVVIIRQKDGSRFQFPMQEVLSISAELPPKRQSSTNRTAEDKKVACHFAVAGGTAYTPNGWGGYINPTVFVGTHTLRHLPIAVGGTIGYHGVFAQGNTYSWIPLQASIHFSPTVNSQLSTVNSQLSTVNCQLSTVNCQLSTVNCQLSIGYACALSQDYTGGICAGMEIGWSHAIGNTSSILVAFNAQALQTRMHVTETVNGNSYHNFRGCTLVSLGMKLGIQF